ncbi:Riboflavin transporter [Defluviimonas aquaemixtae]|uniref:Riboflavin transporter n=1 Tax=Albidovulum aquaemixtae TaxID=1542388 RepID=A0A2R8B7Q8_9RHOB|nr:DMT family transporter [Defluviimonas aquaemixtae]SPH18543.1 Riboflavin transporter [Defluviimonas aquaemixtae]
MSLDPQQRPVAGILWMLATGLCFVVVTGIVRHLGTGLPAAQSAFIRFVYGIVFLAPTLIPVLRRGLPTGVWPLVLGRGALHVAAVTLWFFAMARIPIAEVTAIGYLNPIVVTAGAALFLGEQLALRRLTAIAVALLGALVVLRPGLREIAPGHLSQLGAAVCFGCSYLFAKRLSALVGPGTLVALLSLTVTAGLAPFAIAVWVPPSLDQLLWLGLVALFATLGHYTMARAFAAAPLTVTQPVTFLQLVWAALLGWAVFGETVDPYVFLGGGMIISAITYITWREAKTKRRALTPPPEAAKL